MGEGTWLIGFVVVQRLTELALARRNTARLKAAGAVEFGAGHYPLMVALHAAWLLTLFWFGRDRPIDPGWLVRRAAGGPPLGARQPEIALDDAGAGAAGGLAGGMRPLSLAAASELHRRRARNCRRAAGARPALGRRDLLARQCVGARLADWGGKPGLDLGGGRDIPAGGNCVSDTCQGIAKTIASARPPAGERHQRP